MKQLDKNQNSAQPGKLYDLADYRFIEVSGPDVLTFLQGQVTCDMRRLEEKDWLLGAQCNPKGRMLISFVAFETSNGICLRVHKSLEQAFEGLKKYAVFTKVKLTQQEMPAQALIGDNILSQVTTALSLSEPLVQGKCQSVDGAILLARAEDWLEIYGENAQLTKWIASALSSGTFILGDNFDEELIQRGIAEVRGESAEEFIPQMFNYEHVDGVSFKKGCYTGQEIVARMQYLGKLKKHLYRGSITGVTLPVGTQLHSAGFNEAQGVVVLSCKHEFLAVVNDHVVANHTLFSPVDGQAEIQWLPLPYAITM